MGHLRNLKRRSVVLMIVLTIVTGGLYYPLWFLRRRAALNQLNSPRKLRRWPALTFLAFVIARIMAEIPQGPDAAEQAMGPAAYMVVTIVQLAVGVLMIFQCFLVRDILEDHLLGAEEAAELTPLAARVQLSGLLTLVFQIFYLQHAINRHIAEPKTA